MKTKKSIYKILFTFVFIMILSLIFYSCNTENKDKINSERIFEVKIGGYNQEFRITVIDSCEYLYSGAGNSKVVFHKGNCKFCAERNKKCK